MLRNKVNIADKRQIVNLKIKMWVGTCSARPAFQKKLALRTKSRHNADGFDQGLQGKGKTMQTGWSQVSARCQLFALSLLAALLVPVSAARADTSSLTSDSTFVFLRPETSSFWRTATNQVMSLPVSFPAGASSATLSVTAPGYSAQYAIATSGDFLLSLPAATSPETENVYDLTLTFNDAAATVRTAKLGLIDAVLPDGGGETRCIAPASAPKWERVKGRAVIPVPYGLTSFTVNGAAVDTGLNGAQGWYPITLLGGQTANLALVAGGESFAASLWRVPEATTVFVR